MDKKNHKKIIGLVLSSGLAFGGVAYAQDQTTQQPVTDETQNQKPLTDLKTTDTDQTATANENVVLSDQELKSQAEQALQEYSGQVNVVVNNGVIFLSGQVPSDTDYEKVVVLTESIKGSKDINAQSLTVKDSTQPLTDTFITAKVKGMLIKTDLFDTNIPSWTIGVETKDGKVFLSGHVSSEADKQKILDVVQSIKEVKGVDDQITISADTTTGDAATPAADTADDTTDQTKTNAEDSNQSDATTNSDSQDNVQQ